MNSPVPSLESVSTINADGSRKFIHPATAHGRFTKLRACVALLLMGVYVGLPWIQINGNPAVFFDLDRSQFHLFGLTFVAQDLWLAFFLITGVGFSLFYVTALFGRVWCGWACPQTVFLDVIRRFERWVEGDSLSRRSLDAQPWTFNKTVRRAIKHALFGAFALGLAHVFMSYFVSLPKLYDMVRQSPWDNWSVFVVVFLMSAALWFNFAWFREQFCIVLCPYGRLQSALLDDDSIVIGYDEKRGEPRGKKGTPGAGHCIDCRKCVQVCPTGIDIRQGMQIECIACSACIDACDEVMDKLERPRGLVRYASINGLMGKKTRIIRPRILLYTLLLLIGATVMTFSLSTIRPATITLTRTSGAPFIVSADSIRNQFFVRVINKQNRPESFTLSVKAGIPGFAASGFEESVDVPALSEQMRTLVVVLPKQNYKASFRFTVQIIAADGSFTAEQTAPFLGPTVVPE